MDQSQQTTKSHTTVTQENLLDVMRARVAAESHIMADESTVYNGVAFEFASHEMVCHKAGEYVLGLAHINTSESFHSMLKRGVHNEYHARWQRLRKNLTMEKV